MITVVFVSAVTCAHCKSIKPILDSLKVSYEEDEVIFTDIEIGQKGENLDFAREWNITSVPTISILVRDKPNEMAIERARLTGTEDITHSKLIYCIESFLGKNEQRDIQSDVLSK